MGVQRRRDSGWDLGRVEARSQDIAHAARAARISVGRGESGARVGSGGLQHASAPEKHVHAVFGTDCKGKVPRRVVGRDGFFHLRHTLACL